MGKAAQCMRQSTAFGEAGLRGFCNHCKSQQLHLYRMERHPAPAPWQKAHHPANALDSDAQGFMPYQMFLPLAPGAFCSVSDQEKQDICVHNTEVLQQKQSKLLPLSNYPAPKDGSTLIVQPKGAKFAWRGVGDGR